MFSYFELFTSSTSMKTLVLLFKKKQTFCNYLRVYILGEYRTELEQDVGLGMGPGSLTD